MILIEQTQMRSRNLHENGFTGLAFKKPADIQRAF
jgi:hypothetical protein